MLAFLSLLSPGTEGQRQSLGAFCGPPTVLRADSRWRHLASARRPSTARGPAAVAVLIAVTQIAASLRRNWAATPEIDITRAGLSRLLWRLAECPICGGVLRCKSMRAEIATTSTTPASVAVLNAGATAGPGRYSR
ncbi:hypothetical protein MRX96_015829 [Rhipicephalus microplus]